MVAYEFNPTSIMAHSPLKMLRRRSRIARGELSVISFFQAAGYGSGTDGVPDSALIPSLPKNCVPRFVGEGAANMVFEITIDGRPVFEGKLLRVPKAGTQAFQYHDLQEYFEDTIVPLLPRECLVEQTLVRLRDSGIVEQINHLLDGWDESPGGRKPRRPDFVGHRVAADAEFGMLVEDMRKKNEGDACFEFKPKWLAQSGSAPKGSTRCRNCAKEAYRNNVKHKSTGIVCPLGLFVKSRELRCETLARKFAQGCDGGEMPLAEARRHADRVLDSPAYDDLIRRLRDAQLEHDSEGPLGAPRTGDRERAFGTAMTLRDCTVFVRVPADPSRPVEVKLGDLDRKNSAVKMAGWRDIEERLIREGYYHAQEKPSQKLQCWFACPLEARDDA